jgi:hypothetical protein
MQQVKHQLTLFVQPQDATVIEAIRSLYNPVQQQLIASHVTLCREDELEPLEVIIAHLQRLRFAPITVQFGSAIRFDDDKGVMLPALGDNTAFHQLRAAVLQPSITTPRLHEPHLTLMHPRNATCTDTIFEAIKAVQLPQQLTFTSITLIQQCSSGKWQSLQHFNL